MSLDVIAKANIDDVTIVWRTSDKIKDCLGFALERDSSTGVPEFIHTGMPFEGEEAPRTDDGKRVTKPSTEWPIQRFVWTDHLAPTTVKVRYRVIPMVGKPGALAKAASKDWSRWTPWVTCRTGSTRGFALYPNRGIVAAPWVNDELEQLAKSDPGHSTKDRLDNAIATTGNRLRERLAGPVLKALRDQFAIAAANDETIYAALYELRDDELTALLCAAGKRCHLILANGAFDPKDPDPNKTEADVVEASTVDLQRRMVPSGHYAHNKFVVFVRGGKANRVWTGSTNWTPSGLCTQANHGLLVGSDRLAENYLAYWQRIHDAKDGYPDAFEGDNTNYGNGPETKRKTRAWFTPVTGHIDLNDARQLIDAATQGVLFLMFRPGNNNTLVDNIKTAHDRHLFIRGVVNQTFLGADNTKPTIAFFNQAADADSGDPEILLPAHLKAPVGQERTEYGVTGVLIHSKTIVLDPFGDHPVVMTGSHNLGEKASESNDDNLLIIENAPGIAAEFAVYIMNIYDQYKWRYERGLARQGSHKAWKGLRTTAAWQNAKYLRAANKEHAFWTGA